MPGPGFKETAFLYAVSSAALTHTLARACSAGRMERCTCDDSPGLESRQAWQWGVCGDNLKYSTKFLSHFLGPKRGSKDLRARADAHNTHVGIKVSALPEARSPAPPGCSCRQPVCRRLASAMALSAHAAVPGGGGEPRSFHPHALTRCQEVGEGPEHHRGRGSRWGSGLGLGPDEAETC